jgi:hypothetical protein
MYKRTWITFFLYWGPALILMGTIFGLSATPSEEMIHFGLYDFVIKKGAHMAGYALLALAFLRGFRYERKHFFWILVLVFLYAASDEIHQFFVPGRNASIIDVFIDLAGGIVAIIISKNRQVRRLVMLGIEADQPD